MQAIDDTRSLVTSKMVGDNLPLSTLKVEFKPCLNQNDLSQSPSTMYYTLEADRQRPDCQLMDGFTEAYDPRYTTLDESVIEYDVQEASGVLDRLEGMP